MKSWKRGLSIGLVLAAVPAFLSAADEGKEKKERAAGPGRGPGLGEIREADKDKDGIVTKDEFTAMVHETMFARMDTNADGKIDDAEMKTLEAIRDKVRERMERPEGRRPQGPPPGGPDAPPPGAPGAPEVGHDGKTPKAPRPEARERLRDNSISAFGQNLEISQRIVKELDVNSDGKIGKDEAPERVLAAFEKLDTNKDGLLDTNDAGLEKNLKDRAKDMRENTGKMLEKMDANADGKLQKSEMPEKLQARFEKLDANADGALDKEELKAMRPEGLPGRRPGKDGEKKKSDEPAAAPAEEKPAV